MSTPYSNLSQSDIERLRQSPQGRAILQQMMRERQREEDQRRRAAQQQQQAQQQQEPNNQQRVSVSSGNRNIVMTERGWEFIVQPTYEDPTGSRPVTKEEINPAFFQTPEGQQLAAHFDEMEQQSIAETRAMQEKELFAPGSDNPANVFNLARQGIYSARYTQDERGLYTGVEYRVPVPVTRSADVRYAVDDPRARQQVYYEAAQNVVSRLQQSGGGTVTSEAIEQEVQFLLGTKYQEGIPVSRTADISEFYQANFSSAALQAQFEESDKERRKREAEERQRMRQEMYELGYGGETISIDAKGNRTYHFVPRVGRPQYEYVSDPTNPFNVQKVEVAQSQTTQAERNPFEPTSTGPGVAITSLFRDIADSLYTAGKIYAAAPTAFFGGKDSAQAWYDIEYEAKRYEERQQPQLESGAIHLALSGAYEGLTTGQTTETQKQAAQFQQAVTSNPAYFAESAAASVALWFSPALGAKAASVIKSSTLFRRLTTGRPYEITPRLHYPQTDYDPFNTGWFRSDNNTVQRAFASSEPFYSAVPSTVQRATFATQTAAQTPTTTRSRRIDIPEGVEPDPTPRVTSTETIRRRTMTTLEDIDKRLGLDVRDYGSFTEVRTSSGTLLMQKRRPQQLLQETKTVQETQTTTIQEPIELTRIEPEPPRPRPRPRPKQEPPKLDVDVRQTQQQLTKTTGRQRNQILVDLRQMGNKGAMDAKTRQKQLLERQITLQTTQKIAQKPKLRAEQVRMTAQTQQSAAIQAYQQQFALKTQQLAKTKPISLTAKRVDFKTTTPSKTITLIKNPPKPPGVTIKLPPGPPGVKLPPMFGKSKLRLKITEPFGKTKLEKLAVANPFAPGFSILGKGDQAKGAKYLLFGSKKRGKKNKGLFDV